MPPTGWKKGDGRKLRDTRAEQIEQTRRNVLRLCSLPSCRVNRWETHKFCKPHSRRELRYAHPEQHAIPKKMITESVKVVEKWLAAQRDTEKPLALLALLLDPTRCPADFPNTRETLKALARPRMHQRAKRRRPAVTPLEALTRVLAVAHAQSIAPSRFFPDVWGREPGTVFWTQAAWAVLRARITTPLQVNPLPDGRSVTVKGQRPPERAGMEWFFGRLREACAPVIAAWTMDRAREADVTQDNWKTERAMYETTTGNPTNEYQGPTYEERLTIWRGKLEAAKGAYTRRMQLMAQMPQKPKERTQPMEKTAPWSVSKNTPTIWEEP
jgi:hypothetical protein